METIRKITIQEEEIEVKVSYHISNDGIGWTEFWGSRSFDRGTDYADIDDIEPVVPCEDHARYITEHLTELATQLSDEIEID